MKIDRRLVFRVLAGVLILAAMTHVLMVVPRVFALARVLPAGAWLFAAGYAVSAATALLACGLGVLLLWRAPDRADARMLTLFLGFLAIFWGSLFRFVDVGAETSSVSVMISYGSGWVSESATMSFLLAVAAFVSFSALFPRRLTADRLPPPRRLPKLRAVRAALLRPAVVWGVAVAILLFVRVTPPVAERVLGPPAGPDGSLRWHALVPIVIAGAVYTVLPLAALGLGVRNLRTSYRIATREERRRILWVVAGFSAAAWMILGSLGLLATMALLDLDVAALGFAIPLAIFLAPLVAVGCAAVGILYSGAIDAALLLQRSNVWGALGVLGVIAFAGLENALSSWVEDRVGLPGVVGSMIAGGIVTAALIPVRRPLQRIVASWASGRAAGPMDADAAGTFPASGEIEHGNVPTPLGSAARTEG
jgi:hypothetical protein